MLLVKEDEAVFSFLPFTPWRSGTWLGRHRCQPRAQQAGAGSTAVGQVFAQWLCCLWRVLGQWCACSACPGLGLLVHFPLDLGPILAARHALVNEASSVPSQLL